MKKLTIRSIIISITLFLLSGNVSAATHLVPGGQIIGLALADSTLTVVSIDANLGKSAKEAGLQVGDRITRVDNTDARSIADVRSAVEGCEGAVKLNILRSGKAKQLRIDPAATSDGPKLGIYIKEGVTGIGTVTFYDPATGTYGALGHGVNDQEGHLLSMRHGSAFPATILSVRKGASGKPGQLVGALTGAEPIGTVSKNTVQGIFGKAVHNWQGPSLPTGQAKTGPAIIRSTIDDHDLQEYSVEILKIYPANSTGRNMLIKITDERLLDTTGGIVQGMSGSPIIQDGKLVGAVTHVLVNDPTTGYGIFIENMLETANQVADEQAKKEAS